MRLVKRSRHHSRKRISSRCLQRSSSDSSDSVEPLGDVESSDLCTAVSHSSVEVKNVDGIVFRAWEDGPPMVYQLQVQHEIACGGYARGVLAVCIGGNDLDIALAFKCLMPLLGMGGETEKGTALPILPWWNAVAINDVPAQSDFYSTANGRLLNDLLRSARDADKVALLLKVWRQRLSYRLVRSAEESKIALSSAASVETALPFIQDELATAIAQQGLEAALDQPLTRIMEQVQLALDSSQTTPDVIYLTGGSARSPLIKKALTAQLPGIPLAGGDDFGSVTAGLARWAQVVFR